MADGGGTRTDRRRTVAEVEDVADDRIALVGIRGVRAVEVHVQRRGTADDAGRNAGHRRRVLRTAIAIGKQRQGSGAAQTVRHFIHHETGRDHHGVQRLNHTGIEAADAVACRGKPDDLGLDHEADHTIAESAFGVDLHFRTGGDKAAVHDATAARRGGIGIEAGLAELVGLHAQTLVAAVRKLERDVPAAIRRQHIRDAAVDTQIEAQLDLSILGVRLHDRQIAQIRGQQGIGTVTADIGQLGDARRLAQQFGIAGRRAGRERDRHRLAEHRQLGGKRGGNPVHTRRRIEQQARGLPIDRNLRRINRRAGSRIAELAVRHEEAQHVLVQRHGRGRTRSRCHTDRTAFRQAHRDLVEAAFDAMRHLVDVATFQRIKVGRVAQAELVEQAAAAAHGRFGHRQTQYVGRAGNEHVFVAADDLDLGVCGDRTRTVYIQRGQGRRKIKQSRAESEVGGGTGVLRIGDISAIAVGLVGRVLQQLLHLRRRQLGARLKEQRNRAGHMWRSHRGAGDRPVVRQPACLTAGTDDLTRCELVAARGVVGARRGDIRIVGRIAVEASAGTAGQATVAGSGATIIVVGYTDHARRGVLAVAGSQIAAAVAAIVAGREHADHAFVGERLDQCRKHTVRVVGAATRVAPGVVDDPNLRFGFVVVVEDVLIGLGSEEDRDRLTGPVRVQARLGRNTGESALDRGRRFGVRIGAGGGSAAAGGDAGDMRTMTARGIGRQQAAEIQIECTAQTLFGFRINQRKRRADHLVVVHDAIREVWMRRIEPGVHDGDAHATAVDHFAIGVVERAATHRLLRDARTRHPGRGVTEELQWLVFLDVADLAACEQRQELGNRADREHRIGVLAVIAQYAQAQIAQQCFVLGRRAGLEVNECAVGHVARQLKQTSLEQRIDLDLGGRLGRRDKQSGLRQNSNGNARTQQAQAQGFQHQYSPEQNEGAAALDRIVHNDFRPRALPARARRRTSGSTDWREFSVDHRRGSPPSEDDARQRRKLSIVRGSARRRAQYAERTPGSVR